MHTAGIHSGIHEGGRRALLRLDDRHAKYRHEANKLSRRLAILCQPKGILGELQMIRFRHRMIKKLRQRFLLHEALF